MEYSRFFNSVGGDRLYGQEDFSDFLKSLVFTGLLKDQLNELEATADGVSLDITVDTGRAFVEGFQYLNDSSKVLTLDSETLGQDRIDRIIVKMDKETGSRSVITTILKGSPSGSPIAPALTRAGDVYELSLAQVLITGGQSYIDLIDVTNERGDATLCPYAKSGAVTVNAPDSITNDMLVSDIKIGSLASLATTIKTSIVNAINELVTSIGTLSTSISNIISGTTTVGNTDKLDTHDSTYFATQSGLSNHEDNIAGATIGHIKNGGDITIDGAGEVTVNDAAKVTDYGIGVDAVVNIIVDLDTLKTGGIFSWTTDSPNAPEGATAGSLLVLPRMSSGVTQVAIVFQNGSMYKRYYLTTWSAWTKMWSEDNDGTGSGLDADLLDSHDTSYFLNEGNANIVQSATVTITTGSWTASNGLVYKNFDISSAILGTGDKWEVVPRITTDTVAGYVGTMQVQSITRIDTNTIRVYAMADPGGSIVCDVYVTKDGGK